MQCIYDTWINLVLSKSRTGGTFRYQAGARIFVQAVAWIIAKLYYSCCSVNFWQICICLHFWTYLYIMWMVDFSWFSRFCWHWSTWLWMLIVDCGLIWFLRGYLDIWADILIFEFWDCSLISYAHVSCCVCMQGKFQGNFWRSGFFVRGA